MGSLVHCVRPLVGCTAALLCVSGAARAQVATTQILSVSTSGAQGNAASTGTMMSPDGRYVSFTSAATNLVLGDINGLGDAFVRDRLNGTTTLISVASSGAQGNYPSVAAGMSGDGRFVAFQTLSTNLVPNDLTGHEDVFVRDLVTAQTERVSVSSSGVEGNQASYGGALSFDGRYVLFDSNSSNLVPNDNNGQADVFRHDRQTGVTSRVTVNASGVEADWGGSGGSMSNDGRYVCFESVAANLVPNDNNSAPDMFVKDMQTGQVVRVPMYVSIPLGVQFTGGMISGDGRWVLFQSYASNLVPGDNNGTADVFVHDLQTGVTSLVSVDANGASANGWSGQCIISADGRYVTFSSVATNLVPQPTNGVTQVYLRDLQAGTTIRVSVDSNGVVANDHASIPMMSGDGRYVGFSSVATNLVANDTNNAQDVFVHHQFGPTQPVFCPGDGSGTACPCGNSSPAGSVEGCTSSLGVGGRLLGYGWTSVSSGDVTLFGSQMPSSFALYFQGTTMSASGAGSVFGDGLRCAGGSVTRIGAKLNVAGTSHFPDAGDPLLSVRGGCSAGDVRTYQVWYRNAAPFCTPSTFNLTNGVQVTWGP